MPANNANLREWKNEEVCRVEHYALAYARASALIANAILFRHLIWN
ncbi:MAG: hypothetical protein HOP17_13095 [Acidobacteria bacterium]|nr:hypothetical protein [Acidobacteriota bacterium]